MRPLVGFHQHKKWEERAHCFGRELGLEEGKIQFWLICYLNGVTTNIGGVWHQPWLKADWQLLEVTELFQFIIKW